MPELIEEIEPTKELVDEMEERIKAMPLEDGVLPMNTVFSAVSKSEHSVVRAAVWQLTSYWGKLRTRKLPDGHYGLALIPW